MTKPSKAPFVLGGCGCVCILIALALLGGWFMTRDAVPPIWGSAISDDGELSRYTNSREGRTGSLDAYYVDFEFDYPSDWVMKPQGPETSNYVSVERSAGTDTCENFNVGFFQTTGSEQGNRLLYPALITQLEAQFATQLSDLQKVDEGPWTVGNYDAWQALFLSDSGSGDVYMRIVLLPTPDASSGVAIIMMGTPACGDLTQPYDLGVTGELPVILSSFRFTG